MLKNVNVTLEVAGDCNILIEIFCCGSGFASDLAQTQFHFYISLEIFDGCSVYAPMFLHFFLFFIFILSKG